MQHSPHIHLLFRKHLNEHVAMYGIGTSNLQVKTAIVDLYILVDYNIYFKLNYMFG